MAYIPGKVQRDASPLNAKLTNEIKRLQITSHITNHMAECDMGWDRSIHANNRQELGGLRMPKRK